MKTKTPNPFFVIILFLVFITGVIHIFEPNLGGAYGSADAYSLARILGWLAACLSTGAMTMELGIVLTRNDKAAFIDILVFGLCLVAIASGLLGAITGVCPGVFKTSKITTLDMRILEGVYATAGFALTFVYVLYRDKVIEFIVDEESK